MPAVALVTYSSDGVHYELRDRIASLTIDRPPVNVLGLATIRALDAAVGRAVEDKASVLVLGGWTLLDAYRWNELNADQRALTIGFGVSSLLAFIVLRLMERPFARELRLARQGYVGQGQIVTIGPARGRRRRVTVTYSFRTVAGLTLEGRCLLPRRVSAVTLEPGQPVCIEGLKTADSGAEAQSRADAVRFEGIVHR